MAIESIKFEDIPQCEAGAVPVGKYVVMQQSDLDFLASYPKRVEWEDNNGETRVAVLTVKEAKLKTAGDYRVEQGGKTVKVPASKLVKQLDEFKKRGARITSFEVSDLVRI